MSLQRCGFFGELLKNQQHAFFGEGQARGLLIARAYVCHFITSQKIEQNQKRVHRNASLLFSAALFFFWSTPRFLASLIASKPNICVSGNRIRRRDNDNGNRRLNCPKPRQVAVSSDSPTFRPSSHFIGLWATLPGFSSPRPRGHGYGSGPLERIRKPFISAYQTAQTDLSHHSMAV